MATITQVGLEWLSDKALDNETDVIDEIAVGSDGSSESFFATDMGTQEFRAAFSNPNVTLSETDNEGKFEVTVEVTGGTEVPAGTIIREVALFTSGDVLIAIGNITAVQVDSGASESFRIEVDPNVP